MDKVKPYSTLEPSQDTKKAQEDTLLWDEIFYDEEELPFP